MVKSAKYLLIGSTEAYSGKSATILGMGHQLKKKGIAVGYGKVLGTWKCDNPNEIEKEEDVSFLAQTLELSKNQVRSPLLYLDEETLTKRITGEDTTDYSIALQQYVEEIEGDLVLLEGPGTIWEGTLFDLSIGQIAECIDGSILLVARYTSLLLIANLLTAKKYLGDRLIGIVINNIPPDCLETVENTVIPFLEAKGIPVLGILPKNRLLNSVSVRELAKRLNAQILCRPDRLDLIVESLTIGAMNVNSALEYFRQGENMAVVTGGDRTDLQLAALETSTHCLILTGHLPPQSLILNRAEDLEIPILSVKYDTLTTVEIVDQAFGKAPIHEPIKVHCIQNLVGKHFDLDRLIDRLGLEPLITTRSIDRSSI